MYPLYAYEIEIPGRFVLNIFNENLGDKLSEGSGYAQSVTCRSNGHTRLGDRTGPRQAWFTYRDIRSCNSLRVIHLDQVSCLKYPTARLDQPPIILQFWILANSLDTIRILRLPIAGGPLDWPLYDELVNHILQDLAAQREGSDTGERLDVDNFRRSLTKQLHVRY